MVKSQAMARVAGIAAARRRWASRRAEDDCAHEEPFGVAARFDDLGKAETRGDVDEEKDEEGGAGDDVLDAMMLAKHDEHGDDGEHGEERREGVVGLDL